MSVTYQQLVQQTGTPSKSITYAIASKLLPKQELLNCTNCQSIKCVKWLPNPDVENLPFQLRCSKCAKKTPISKGTWFDNTQLSLSNAIRIILFFVYNMPIEMISYELNINKKQVVNYFIACRQVCYAITNQSVTQIGGPNHIIELGECLLFDDTRRRQIKEKITVLFIGGVDRYSKECFVIYIKLMDRRDAVISILSKHIKAGSRVISTLWEKYGISNETCNLKMEFIVADDCLNHTQNMKQMWRALRSFFKGKKYDEYAVTLKLAEFLYFRKHAEPRIKQYIRFLQDIAIVHPGYGKEGLKVLEKPK